MSRPVLPCCIAFISGILLASGIRTVIPAITVLFVYLCGFYLLRKKMGKALFIALSLCLIVGFCLHSFREAVSDISYQEYIGQTIQAELILERNPVIGDFQETCVASVRHLWVNGQQAARPLQGFGRVQLRAKSDLSRFRCGDVLLVEGTVTKPKPQRNPGGYNERLTLLSEGMTGIFHVMSLNMQGHINTPLRDAGYTMSAHVKSVLLEQLPEKEAYVLLGMLLGDVENISNQEKKLFRTSGLMHIMAVSGANVAFVVMPLLWLLLLVGMNKRWSGLLVLPALLMFSFATGLEPSVVRAAVMAAMMLAGLTFFRKPDLACSLGATAMIMLLHNSWILFGAGFQLSFLAVSCLLLFQKQITSMLPIAWPKILRAGLGGTVAVQIGLTPLMAILFHTISTWTVWANLLVLPLTGALTLLGTAMALLDICLPWACVQPIGFVTRYLVDYILWVAEAISRLPFAQNLIPTIHPAAWIGYCACVFWVRFSTQIKGASKWHLRPYGTLVIVLAAVLLTTLSKQQLKVLFMDVGQGDAVFVSYPGGESLLIDSGGNAFGDKEDTVGEKIVIPGILEMGHSKPEKILLTHGHSDHIGGAVTVLEQMGGILLLPPVDDKNLKALETIAQEMSMQTRIVSAGDQLDEGKTVMFTVLSPEADCQLVEDDENENSLVLELVYGNFQMLLMGDAGKETEARLLKQNMIHRTDILKVGHHGSKNASTTPFLDASNPRIGIVSVGRNIFGHPSKEAVERLQISGTDIFSTIDCGAVLLETDGETIQLRTWGIVKPHWMTRLMKR